MLPQSEPASKHQRSRHMGRHGIGAKRNLLALMILVICAGVAIAIPAHTCPAGWSLGSNVSWFVQTGVLCGRPTIAFPAHSQMALKFVVAAMGLLLAVAVAWRPRAVD
jgi:hypothetical protein